jgi:hypothetical protein
MFAMAVIEGQTPGSSSDHALKQDGGAKSTVGSGGDRVRLAVYRSVSIPRRAKSAERHGRIRDNFVTIDSQQMRNIKFGDWVFSNGSCQEIFDA